VILARETSIGKYVTQVKGRFYTLFTPITRGPQIVRQLPLGTTTILDVSATFKDGSTLTMAQTLAKSRDRVEVLRYGYEYERPSGFFFHCEMEEATELSHETELEARLRKLWKPRYHLHVGARKEIAGLLKGFPPELREHDGPHYATCFIPLDYMLAVILISYFPEYEAQVEKLDLADFANSED